MEELYPRPDPPASFQGPKINIRATFTKAQELAEAANKDQVKIPISEQIPPPYHEFLDVFDEQKSFRLPKHGPNDHAIDLKPDFTPSHERLIQLTAKEDPELTKFLKVNLERDWIRPSKSPMASPFFFIKKKDGSLRPVQDY
jgi:hypothetical protein